MNAPPAMSLALSRSLRDQTHPPRERRIAVAWLASLALPFGWALSVALQPLLLGTLAIYATLQAWYVVLMRTGLLTRQPDPVRAAVVAIVLAMLLPEGTPLWQQVLSASVGFVFAEGLFGGRGHAFLHPAAVALAFHVMSWDTTVAGAWINVPVSVVLPGVVLLGLLGMLPMATLAAVSATLTVAALSTMTFDASAATLVAIVAVYLVADPASGSAMPVGRVLHGLLFGVLAVLLFSPAAPLEPMVQSALLASLAAPLIDRLVLHRHLSGRTGG